MESIIKDAEADGCRFHRHGRSCRGPPGAVAALTTKFVIGVPCGGRVPYDSLLSIVQLPPGVPAATVGVTAVTTPVTSRPRSSPSPTWRTRPASPRTSSTRSSVKAMDREVNGS